MSSAKNEKNYTYVAHRVAAIAGIIILFPTAAYWITMLMAKVPSLRHFHLTYLSYLPEKFMFYNFISPLLTYWINKMVISKDRFDEILILPINNILFFLCYIFIICQIVIIFL